MPLLTADQYAAQPSIPGNFRHAYGTHPSQFGELYLPSGVGPHPVIILIHGGCWQAKFGLEPLGTMARALADCGVAVWNVEYRRLGNGGGWPCTFADVAAATDHLVPLARRHHLDLGRVTAVGHSAGGHLALWLATRRQLPADHVFHQPDTRLPRAVIALAGIPNLPVAARRHICGDAVSALMGGEPDDLPARYATASPHALAPLAIPHLHIVGAADQVVPVDYLEDYVNMSRAAGDDANIVILPQTGHFEIVLPATAIWPAVQTQIVALATADTNASN